MARGALLLKPLQEEAQQKTALDFKSRKPGGSLDLNRKLEILQDNYTDPTFVSCPLDFSNNFQQKIYTILKRMAPTTYVQSFFQNSDQTCA